MADERRQCSRIRKQGEFQFRRCDVGAENEKLSNGQLVDYSMAGIRFFTSEQLEKNTSLLIKLDLGNLSSEVKSWRDVWQTEKGEHLSVIGSVMWCQQNTNGSSEFEVGTRFIRKV